MPSETQELQCAACAAPVRRGQALCRKHWMAIAHWHRVQIGNAMTEEREAGVGPDEHGQYQSEEYKAAVTAAVESLRDKERGKEPV